MTTTTQCRAKNPRSCPYHGTEITMNEAKASGDFDKYFQARSKLEAMKPTDEFDLPSETVVKIKNAQDAVDIQVIPQLPQVVETVDSSLKTVVTHESPKKAAKIQQRANVFLNNLAQVGLQGEVSGDVTRMEETNTIFIFNENADYPLTIAAKIPRNSKHDTAFETVINPGKANLYQDRRYFGYRTVLTNDVENNRREIYHALAKSEYDNAWREVAQKHLGSRYYEIDVKRPQMQTDGSMKLWMKISSAGYYDVTLDRDTLDFNLTHFNVHSSNWIPLNGAMRSHHYDEIEQHIPEKVQKDLVKDFHDTLDSNINKKYGITADFNGVY